VKQRRDNLDESEPIGIAGGVVGEDE